jgi:hypothetical protein
LGNIPNLEIFFSENETKQTNTHTQKFVILREFFGHFLEIKKLNWPYLDLGTSQVTTCSSTFVKMLQPT